MAQRIVNFREIVDVQNGDHIRLELLGRQALITEVNKLIAVGQAAQPVVKRQLVQLADLLVSPHCSGYCGIQFGAGEFRLGFVVVDIKIVDSFDFGRIARLARAQDDAQLRQAQILSDGFDQSQARILALHNYIQQHYRYIGL